MSRVVRGAAPYLAALLGTGLLVVTLRWPPIEPTRTLQVGLTLTLVLGVVAFLALVARHDARHGTGDEPGPEALFSDEERRRLHALRVRKTASPLQKDARRPGHPCSVAARKRCRPVARTRWMTASSSGSHTGS
jgi:hypothetical protein